jgi:hypothetical protein
MQKESNGIGLAKLAMLGLVAGSSSLIVGCFDSTSSSDDTPAAGASSSVASSSTTNTGNVNIGDAKTPEEFKKICTDLGMELKEVTCSGQATCAGAYWNLDDTVNTTLEAAATNACNGIQCLPGSEMSSMELSSTTENNVELTENQKKVLAATSETEFKTLCNDISGTISSVECNGNSTCAGIIWNEGEKNASLSSCQGTNSCAGTQCVEGNDISSETQLSSSTLELSSETQMVSSEAVVDKALAKKMALEATSLEVFEKACDSVDAEITTHATCSGYNSCAGVYFNVAEGSASEVTCQGHASCKGSSCKI